MSKKHEWVTESQNNVAYENIFWGQYLRGIHPIVGLQILSNEIMIGKTEVESLIIMILSSEIESKFCW